MAEEFRINSSSIEAKINQLLPSQGGQGAGIDFSASTMVIPIVDLTESAEGSQLRQDLQSALGFDITSFEVTNATNTTIINTTGYFRIFCTVSTVGVNSGGSITVAIFDGATSKTIINGKQAVELSSAGTYTAHDYDFIVKLQAGESIRVTANQSGYRVSGCSRQIADINGNLT